MHRCWPVKKCQAVGWDPGAVGQVLNPRWGCDSRGLSQASSRTSAVRDPWLRTTCPSVWKPSRRTRSGIRTSWRNFAAPWPGSRGWSLCARRRPCCGPCTSTNGSTIPWVWVPAPDTSPPHSRPTPNPGPSAGPARAPLSCHRDHRLQHSFKSSGCSGNGKARFLKRRNEHFQWGRGTG